MTIDELKQYHLMLCDAEWGHSYKPIRAGMIYAEHDCIYIFQNNIRGMEPIAKDSIPSKYGYTYSIKVDNHFLKHLHNFEIIPIL